jgi:ABC-type enterochelin transport system permease subunit
VSLEDSIKYLQTLGAWEDTELQDLEENKMRLLWIAILDCKENNTQYWYMGS